MSNSPEQSQILIYETDDKQTRLEVRLQDETVWLTQNHLADLLQTTKQNVSLHIKNIFSEKELAEDSVVKESLTTATDGKDELEILNLIVSQYLDFAELQARSRKTMAMAEWIRKLDDFLRLNDRQILQDAGKVSAKLAEETVSREFEKFQRKQSALDAEQVDKDFEEAVKKFTAPKQKRK